jgi:hypothetical protein
VIHELKPFRRWTPARKMAVLGALSRQLITVEQCCQAHRLTPEELLAWERNLMRFGEPGLKATQTQRYRDKARPPQRSFGAAR